MWCGRFWRKGWMESSRGLCTKTALEFLCKAVCNGKLRYARFCYGDALPLAGDGFAGTVTVISARLAPSRPSMVWLKTSTS